MRLRLYDCDNDVYDVVDLCDLEHAGSVLDSYRDYYHSGYFKEHPEYIMREVGTDTTDKPIFLRDVVELSLRGNINITAVIIDICDSGYIINSWGAVSPVNINDIERIVVIGTEPFIKE